MIPRETQKFIKDNFSKGKVVCLTGAGISAESGIPTFRGKGGMWEKYDPEIYANAEGLMRVLRERPRALVSFLVDFYSVLLEAKPNPAHLALGLLEKKSCLEAVITQNIDNLHQQAGNRNVVELHGNALRIRCMRCLKTFSLEKDRLREMIQLLKKNQNSKFRLLKIFSRYFPNCSCGGRFRIDVVLFGEALPQKELSLAYQYLDRCSLLLLVGTSLVVYPAAGLPFYAKEMGAKIIEINSEKTHFSDICDLNINGSASEVLPEIIRVLGYA